MSLTPEQRSLRARIAAHSRWASEDPKPSGRRAQAGLRARFEREAAERYPDLPAAEVARRAESLYKAHMARLALASAKSRRARRRKPSTGDAA